MNKDDFVQLNIFQIKELIKFENVKFVYKVNKRLLPAKIIECALQDQHGLSLQKNTLTTLDGKISQISHL